MHWWTHWYLIATHKKCPLDQAERILVQEHYQGKHTIYYVKRVFELNQEAMVAIEESDKGFKGIELLDNNAEEKNFQIAIHQHRGVFKCKYLRHSLRFLILLLFTMRLQAQKNNQ